MTDTERDEAFYAKHYGPESGWKVHRLNVCISVPSKLTVDDSLQLIREILDEAQFDIGVTELAAHDAQVRAEMLREGQDAITGLLHPEFGTIWREGDGEAWLAIQQAVAEERERWEDWLFTTNWPFDWTSDAPPPTTAEAMGRIWNERDGWRITNQEAADAIAAESGIARAEPTDTEES